MSQDRVASEAKIVGTSPPLCECKGCGEEMYPIIERELLRRPGWAYYGTYYVMRVYKRVVWVCPTCGCQRAEKWEECDR